MLLLLHACISIWRTNSVGQGNGSFEFEDEFLFHTLKSLARELQCAVVDLSQVNRDEVYDKNSIDKGVAEIIVAKNCYDSPGTAKIGFDARYARFHLLAL
jgi:replicative DNA helicase